MPTTKDLVALVVPCFNEAQRLPKNYWRNLIDTNSSIVWLFVNDGSSDSTDLILTELCEGTSASYIKLPKNLGKGNAIRNGILHILNENQRIKLIGYIDSDGAFSEFDVMKLTSIVLNCEKVKMGNHFDAWISSRVALAGRHVQRKLSRHYLGRLISTFITRSWKDSPYDIQSGFKIFRVSEIFLDAIKQPFKTRWFVDVEILSRLGIGREGVLEIWEEPVTEWSDVKGSKIKFKAFASILKDLLYARLQVKKLLKARRVYGSN